MKKRILSLTSALLCFLLMFTSCGKENTSTDAVAPSDKGLTTEDDYLTQEGAETDASSDESNQQAAAKHGVFGSFTTQTLDGETVDNSIFEGKITMVNIWATFCAPCINEMPYLEKISKAYAQENLQVIGIVCDVYINPDGSLDSYSVNEAKDIAGDTGVTYMNLLPCQALMQAKLNDAYYIPETLFLDENGNQIGESYIGSKSYEDWCFIVDSVLESR